MSAAALVPWAVERAGPFLTADLRAEGHTRHDLARALEARALRSMGRGVLIASQLWVSADARARHRYVVAARLLQKEDVRWVAARRSAAVVHGLPLMGPPPAVAQLLRSPEGSRTRGRSRHERVGPLADSEREEVDGIGTCSAARACFDMACEEPLRNALVALDGALRRGTELSTVLALTKTYAHQSGAIHAARAVELANGLHETPLESLSWAGAHTGGFPVPEPQVRIYLGSRLLARVDGLWREHNVVGQADGMFKDKDRQGVIADKKQDETLEDVGFEVCRWGWDEAYRPETGLYDRWRRAFARGSRQTIDPRVRLVPTRSPRAWSGQGSSRAEPPLHSCRGTPLQAGGSPLTMRRVICTSEATRSRGCRGRAR